MDIENRGEENYRRIVEVAPIPIGVYTAGIFVFVNKAGWELLGAHSHHEIVGHSVVEFVHPDSLPTVLKRMNFLKEGESVPAVEERLVRVDKSSIEVMLSAASLLYQGKPSVQLVANDITERKRMENALKQSEEEYRGLFENAHDAIVVFEPESEVVLDVNQRACEMYGFDRSEFVGMSLLSISKDSARGKQVIADLMDRKTVQNFVTTHYRKDRSEMILEVNAAMVDYKGRPAILSVDRDITERRRIESALHDQEAIYREAITQAEAVPYQRTYDPPTFSFLGEGIKRLCGYSAEEMTPEVFRSMIEETIMMGSNEGLSIQEASMRVRNGENKEWRSDNRMRDRYGNTRWISDSAVQIMDHSGKAIGSIGILQDITGRKLAEQKIRESLNEKEVLLKEIHHRVKNNLQVVSSLLNLQANHLKDEHVREVFKESQNRIRSMALVHEYLYKSSDLAKINFADYLARFLSEIIRSYSSKMGRVQLKSKVDGAMLSVNEAIPCGLIVNELVTNALKYAFPDKSGGEVYVEMRKNEAGEWSLTISDNGIGLPELFTLDKTKTLGMQLVNSFVRQLQGTVRVEKGSGTKFTIEFSESE
jgi:PAS domain S-box-containing protein